MADCGLLLVGKLRHILMPRVILLFCHSSVQNGNEFKCGHYFIYFLQEWSFCYKLTYVFAEEVGRIKKDCQCVSCIVCVLWTHKIMLGVYFTFLACYLMLVMYLENNEVYLSVPLKVAKNWGRKTRVHYAMIIIGNLWLTKRTRNCFSLLGTRDDDDDEVNIGSSKSVGSRFSFWKWRSGGKK